MPSRTRKLLFTGAAALGVAAGAAGISAAATGGSGDTGTTDGTSQESQDETADYTSSITVDDTVEATSEADEAAALADLATVTPEEAAAAATAEVPGDAADPELENQDGNVVYGVDVTAADGTVTEVVVDAGNASILATETEGADDHGDEGDGDGEHDDDHGEQDDATEGAGG